MTAATSVPVALLFQTDELGRHLRGVLNDIGTPIVYESTTHAIDRVSLEQSGARVVVVNLDSELDGDLDMVYDLLGNGAYRVLINEGHVSSRLSGWDQARWMRHLAAKILDAPAATDPPRPAGAEPVPVPVMQPAAAAAVPEPAMPDEAAAVEAAAERTEHVEITAPVESAAVVADAADVDAFDADELFSFDDLEDAPPVAPEPADASIVRFDGFDAAEPIGAAPLETEPAHDDPIDADADAVTLSDAETRLFADFDTASGEDGQPSDTAPAADLDDWLSRAMADDPAAGIEPPRWEDDPLPTESAPVARLDTQPVFSDSFEPAEDDPRPAVPAVPDWNLVSFDLDEETAPPAPTPTPAFGIEKISAAEYMAAASPYAGEESAQAIEPGGLSLELVPIEDAIAPQPAHVEHEVWLDADAIAAVGSPAAARTAASATEIGRIVVLCASIGGPEAVREVIGAIPKDYPALFVLVQHMGEEFIDLLAQQLARATALTIRVPSHGERVAAGDLLIAPPNRDLRIQRDGTVLIQAQAEPPAHQPSIDRILETVAATFAADTLAIVFSGMSDDGAEGCRRVAEAGGQVWVQDPASCVVSEMVENALATGVVHFQGSPTSLAEHLAGLGDTVAAAAP